MLLNQSVVCLAMSHTVILLVWNCPLRSLPGLAACNSTNLFTLLLVLKCYREGVRRNFQLVQNTAAELGTLPGMMSADAFADFGPDHRALVCFCHNLSSSPRIQRDSGQGRDRGGTACRCCSICQLGFRQWSQSS